MSGKQYRPWWDAAFSGIWSGSTLFAQVGLSTYGKYSNNNNENIINEMNSNGVVSSKEVPYNI